MWYVVKTEDGEQEVHADYFAKSEDGVTRFYVIDPFPPGDVVVAEFDKPVTIRIREDANGSAHT